MNEDEREERHSGPHSLSDTLSRLDERVLGLSGAVERLDKTLETYITRIEFMAHFWPVRALVYGMAGLLLGAVLTAVVAIVLKR